MKRNVLLTVPQLLVLVIVATLATEATADSIVNNSVQIQSLTISPGSGSVVISPSYVLARAGVINSQSEKACCSCPQTISWFSADCSIDPVSLTGFVSAKVDIPDGQWAYGGSTSWIYGTFEIAGTTGPVLVQFHAVIPFLQSLTTGDDRESSSLSIGVSFDGLGIVNQQLNYDIGRNSSVFNSGIWDVNNSITLNAGQQYFFWVRMEDSVTANPEPSTVLLFLGGLSPIVLSRLRAMRR